jgi:hypothetical protein
MPARRKYPEPPGAAHLVEPVARHVKVIGIWEDIRITVRGRERQHDVDGAFTRVDRASMNAVSLAASQPGLGDAAAPASDRRHRHQVAVPACSARTCAARRQCPRPECRPAHNRARIPATARAARTARSTRPDSGRSSRLGATCPARRDAPPCGVPEVCLACELQRCTGVSGRP